MLNFKNNKGRNKSHLYFIISHESEAYTSSFEKIKINQTMQYKMKHPGIVCYIQVRFVLICFINDVSFVVVVSSVSFCDNLQCISFARITI